MFNPIKCPVGTLCVFRQKGTFQDVTCIWKVVSDECLKECYYFNHGWVETGDMWTIKNINLHGNRWKCITKEDLAFCLLTNSQVF